MGFLDERQKQLLHLMGVQVWQERGARNLSKAPSESADAFTKVRRPPPPGEAAVENPIVVTGKVPEVGDFDWSKLAGAVSNCTACDLAKTRTQTVFGVGAQQADWMLIGEPPDAEEDRRGAPFAGPAGQLLDAMLTAISLKRQEVYLTNVLKCRPPGNRDPKEEEATLCSGYLDRQIALVQPRLIVAVGRIAAQQLLKTSESLARLRGRVHYYGVMKTPLIVTYHPAYLLRSPAQKRKAWEDLLLGQRLLSAAS